MAEQPLGQCAFCSHETTKASMTRHLSTCQGRQDRIDGSTAAQLQTLVHLRFQDAYGGAYWFDAEVRGTATLDDVDGYLRALWLECCGHLSRFSIGGWGGQELSPRSRVDTAFVDGADVTHVYDFGTESVTQIKEVGRRRAAPLGTRPIALMARNLPPQALCTDCAQTATHICQECQNEWESPGTLCSDHAESHPHEDYGEPIEIVNSPRLGLCGYAGPAVPPY